MNLFLIVSLNLFLLFLQILILNFSIPSINTKIDSKAIIFVSKPIDAFLFFGPTLIRINNPYIISLSSGSENFTSSLHEFQNACKEYNISSDNCIINQMNIEHFQQENWSLSEVKNVVDYYKNKINSTLLISYDYKGMNDHNNIVIHKAIHPPKLDIKDQPLYKSSKMSLMNNNKILQNNFTYNLTDVHTLYLKTPSLYSKYSSFIELNIIYLTLKNSDIYKSQLVFLQSPVSISFFKNLNALKCFHDFSILDNIIQIQSRVSYINNLILPCIINTGN